jgi:FKBP-type peptidyl-prolyl cis-trans isomerase
MLRVLIPSVAIAVVVILVAVLAAVYNEEPAADEKGKSTRQRGGYPPPTGGTDVSKMTDGSAPGADDPQLKDIGGGLKIRDMKVGDGALVKPGQRVWAYYTGWLTNGTVFDSSRKRGEAIDFSLNDVIKGWTDGIPGMKVGGIRKLYIPADLAYGSRARPGIPANSPLIFEVEIVDVQ